MDTRLTDTILLGFISFVFVYVLRLLRVLDTPFRAAGAGLDDVSLFQIEAIHDAMHGRLGAVRARPGRPLTDAEQAHRVASHDRPDSSA